MVGSVSSGMFCNSISGILSGQSLNRIGYDNSCAVNIDLGADLYIKNDSSRKRFETSICSKQDFAMNYLSFNQHENGLGYDLDAEFDTFMKKRGCNNESELQIIAKANCYTMDEYKAKVEKLLQSDINVMQSLGFAKTDMSTLSEYIINNASVEQLDEYFSKRNFLDRLSSLKNTIQGLPYSTAMKFDVEDSLNMIDKMIEHLQTLLDEQKVAQGDLNYRHQIISLYMDMATYMK